MANPSPRATNSSDQIDSSGFDISISEPDFTAVMMHIAAANPEPTIVKAPMRRGHALSGTNIPSPPSDNMNIKLVTIINAVIMPHVFIVPKVDLMLSSSPRLLPAVITSTSPSINVRPINNITVTEAGSVSNIKPDRKPKKINRAPK